MDQMPLVLDPCCGSRMMWFDRGHEGVVASVRTFVGRIVEPVPRWHDFRRVALPSGIRTRRDGMEPG